MKNDIGIPPPPRCFNPARQDRFLILYIPVPLDRASAGPCFPRRRNPADSRQFISPHLEAAAVRAIIPAKDYVEAGYQLMAFRQGTTCNVTQVRIVGSHVRLIFTRCSIEINPLLLTDDESDSVRRQQSHLSGAADCTSKEVNVVRIITRVHWS